jgi:endoribonuclease Dicer
MREYYNQTPEEDRPRVFGMTASPVDAKMAFIEASEQLERTLHAKICTPRIKDTLSALVPRPREEKIYYKPSTQTPHTELFRKISAIASRSDPRSRLKKAFRAAENALEEYGPWMSDRVWRWKLQEMEEKGEMESDPIANRRGKQHGGEKKRKKIWETQTDIQLRESKEEQEREIKRVREIITNEAHFDTKPHLTTDDLSPKVLKLIELLNSVYTTPQTSGIVFVRQRYAASAMHQLIKELELPNIACDMLVGHGMEGDIAMDHRKQVMVINQFRQGKLNLLIATRYFLLFCIDLVSLRKDWIFPAAMWLSVSTCVKH